ncbi:hypothetical protein QBC32DRAFT_340400, partial [Pseudoneurospora amorphoporcata]
MRKRIQPNPLILHVIQTGKFYALSGIYAVLGPEFGLKRRIQAAKSYALVLTGAYAVSGGCSFRGLYSTTECRTQNTERTTRLPALSHSWQLASLTISPFFRAPTGN